MLFGQTRICRALVAGMMAGLVAGGLAVLPTAVAAPGAHAAGDWRWPVAGEILTPYRNVDDPYAAGQHRGIDIAAPVGAAVEAATGGSVTFAGRLPDAGNCVTVLGGGGQYLVSYLHLSAISVKRGASVTAGATVGSVGTTGKRSATEPHLHLSVRLAASGAYVDPLPLLGLRPETQTPADRPGADAAPLASAPPSVVEQPLQHAGSNAQPRTNVQANAQSRSQSRDGRRVQGRSRARGQRSGRGAPDAARPALENVHAHSIGDTASAAPAVAARGSARESHAPRGRVAPPPWPIEPRSLGSRPAARQILAGTPAPETGVVDRAAPRDSGHRRWPLFLFLSLASAAGALLLSRRRPSRDSGPAGDPDHVAIKPPIALAPSPDDAAAPKLHVVAR
jgi:hypothetical protein